MLQGAGLHKGDRGNPIDMNLENPLLITTMSAEEDLAALVVKHEGAVDDIIE